MVLGYRAGFVCLFTFCWIWLDYQPFHLYRCVFRNRMGISRVTIRRSKLNRCFWCQWNIYQIMHNLLMAFSMSIKRGIYSTRNLKPLLLWRLKSRNYKKWYRKIIRWIQWKGQRWVRVIFFVERVEILTQFLPLFLFFSSVVCCSKIRYHLIFWWDFHRLHEISHHDPWNGPGLCANQIQHGKIYWVRVFVWFFYENYSLISVNCLESQKRKIHRSTVFDTNIEYWTAWKWRISQKDEDNCWKWGSCQPYGYICNNWQEETIYGGNSKTAKR